MLKSLEHNSTYISEHILSCSFDLFWIYQPVPQLQKFSFCNVITSLLYCPKDHHDSTNFFGLLALYFLCKNVPLMSVLKSGFHMVVPCCFKKCKGNHYDRDDFWFPYNHINCLKVKDRRHVVITNFLGPSTEFWVKIHKQNFYSLDIVP